MKSPEKLKELILSEVDLSKVMIDYGVEFVYNPELVDEAQLRCPFHGKDRKPSARYYRETQTMFCWVCHKSWDVIRFVMEKEQMYYKTALLHIVNKYQLDISVIPDEPEFIIEKIVPISDTSVWTLDAEKKIKEFRNKLIYKRYSALVTAYHIIMFNSSKDIDISEDIQKLNNKLDTLKIG